MAYIYNYIGKGEIFSLRPKGKLFDSERSNECFDLTIFWGEIGVVFICWGCKN